MAKLACFLIMVGLSLGAASAGAQDNPFAPAITVNGRVISNYELTQRIMFFSLLQPGIDATTEARNSLIDDRLRLYAAEQLDVTVSPDDVIAGMESFASRANLTAEEFLKAIAPRGVAPETFRDFVQAGLVWREAVRAKYLATTRVSEREVDRAIAGGLSAGGELKLLLSEIAIPTGGVTDALELANRIKGDVSSGPGFSAAARIHSASPTAARGGLLEWVELSKLPPAIAAQVATLDIGQMTDPIPVEGSVMLFFVRDRSTVAGDASGAKTVDYVRFAVAPGTDTARIRAGVDRCEDLLPLGRGMPEEAMERASLPEAALPVDLGAALQGLDAGETTVLTSASGQMAIVMLCSRQPLADLAPSRDDIRSQLLNQKMALRAQSYLEELRAEALIVER